MSVRHAHTEVGGEALALVLVGKERVVPLLIAQRQLFQRVEHGVGEFLYLVLARNLVDAPCCHGAGEV